MRLSFTKMEGAGNDYIYVDAVRQAFPLQRAPALARTWSDRHFGIGGDGLILLAPSATADVRMIMFNADGSRGAMCGNGLSCAAVLAHDLGLATAVTFAFRATPPSYDSGVTGQYTQLNAAQMATASRRRFGSGKMLRIRDRVEGISIAPKKPSAARPAMSHSALGAKAVAAETAAKPTLPIRSRRRRPIRSPRLPMATSRPASTNG